MVFARAGSKEKKMSTMPTRTEKGVRNRFQVGSGDSGPEKVLVPVDRR
jgi:hypothetical protein